MGTMIAAELAKRGITIYDRDGRPPEFEKGGTIYPLAPTDGRIAPPSPTNVISWMSVPTHRDGSYDRQFNSILTMWESRQLPEAFRDTLHEFDLIMVPSPQNVELFSKYHPNVRLVTLGVEPELWHPIPAPPVGRFFDFLIAGRGSRKGTDIAYKAFKTVFRDFTPTGSQPIPRLHMKSLRGHGDFWSDNVVHHVGMLEPLAERDLYAAAHAYIQPSRGEGFGLQPLQAMALGRPTILTDAHGHESFAKLGIPISADVSKADYFIYGNAGEWWEPDLDETCEAMWDVYNNYTFHVEHAARSAETIAREFTWANSADQYIAAHDGQIGRPYTGTGVWTESVRRLYEIITTRDWDGDICGIQYQFQTGKPYHVLADVKRILFDSNVLDPACLGDGDQGLTPGQVEQLGKYRADHEYCRTCHRRLNDGTPTRADEIFADLEEAALNGVAVG
jgi:glycosyltransferase involved in cell wall biosynthesis